MGSWQEHVLPHGPLISVGPRLWYLIGQLKRGDKFTRNMVVHKLASGGLLIHSAVAVNDATLAELCAHGKPEVLVVPQRFHRLDAGVWKERFPDLLVLAPRVAVSHVEKIVKVDATCEERLPGFGVIIHEPPGLRPFELCFEMDTGNGKALVVTDMLMNISDKPGFRGWFMRVIGSSGFFGITAIGRLLLLKDRAAFKAWLWEMADRPDLRAICVAHGDPIVSGAPAALRAAAERLG